MDHLKQTLRTLMSHAFSGVEHNLTPSGRAVGEDIFCDVVTASGSERPVLALV